MSIKSVRRIGSQLLGVGESKVRIKSGEEKRATEALTRDDVRSLINDGIVFPALIRGVSKARARVRAAQRKKGRRRGLGKRKGSKYSKVSKKEGWMARVRVQRAFLAELFSEKRIERETKKHVYLMIKGGAFKGRGGIMSYLESNKLLKK
jgi:large subunit ribosomal protein L19e